MVSRVDFNVIRVWPVTMALVVWRDVWYAAVVPLDPSTYSVIPMGSVHVNQQLQDSDVRIVYLDILDSQLTDASK